MPARVPVGRQPLDQPLKRQLLVLDRVEQPAPGPTQQLRERRRAGQVAAQHDRVDEGADQLLELRPAAVVDRDPDDHVLLAAVSVEQHLVGREERHEQRGALRPGQGIQGVHQLGGHRRPVPCPAQAGYSQTRSVGRQL